MSDSNSSSGGIGFVGLLTIVFITLKLCGVITWSWWWVLAPLWIGFLIVFFVLLGVGIWAMRQKRKNRHPWLKPPLR